MVKIQKQDIVENVMLVVLFVMDQHIKIVYFAINIYIYMKDNV